MPLQEQPSEEELNVHANPYILGLISGTLIANKACY